MFALAVDRRSASLDEKRFRQSQRSIDAGKSDFLIAGLSIGLIKIEDSSDLDMLDMLVIRLDASSTFIFVPLNCLVP